LPLSPQRGTEKRHKKFTFAISSPDEFLVKNDQHYGDTERSTHFRNRNGILKPKRKILKHERHSEIETTNFETETAF